MLYLHGNVLQFVRLEEHCIHKQHKYNLSAHAGNLQKQHGGGKKAEAFNNNIFYCLK